ncbi:hypothetical protein ACFLQU_06165, partial [Verrucomicrobiota bacterium]
CCLIAVPAFATRQIQDKLHYQSKVYKIGGYGDFPLDVYFRSCPEEQRKKKYEILKSKGIYRSTACWRGHVATWVIETNTLFLTQVEDGDSKRTADALKPIFGDKIKEGRLKAFWFSGPIRVEDKLLVFEAGKLIKTLSPGKETINKVHKDLKKKYSEQRKKDSQQSTAPVPQKAAQSAPSSVR